MNFLNNNKGFFQGGKSFGGKGFLEPLGKMLGNLKPQAATQQDPNSPQAFNGAVGEMPGRTSPEEVWDPILGKYVMPSKPNMINIPGASMPIMNTHHAQIALQQGGYR